MNKTDLSSEERIQQIEDKLAKPKESKPRRRCCPFCSLRKTTNDNLKYFDSLYEDVFCNAYQKIENKSIPIGLDPETCHHGEFLLDTAWPTISFIKRAIDSIKSLRDWDGIHLSDIDPYFPEDVISILADKDKMEFILLWHERCEKHDKMLSNPRYANTSDPTLYELYSSLLKQKRVTGIPARDAILRYKPDLTEEQIDDLVGHARFRESYDNIGIFAENAITIIQNIDENHLKSLNPYEYYCPNRKHGKHFASYQQWQHNKHHLVKDHREFRKWLDGVESKIGRKMQNWSFLFDSGIT